MPDDAFLHVIIKISCPPGLNVPFVGSYTLTNHYQVKVGDEVDMKIVYIFVTHIILVNNLLK